MRRRRGWRPSFHEVLRKVPRVGRRGVVEKEEEESMSLLAGMVEETEFVRPTMRLLKPEVDKESGNQLSMVVNSGEVGRYSITFVLPIFLSSVLVKQSDQEWGGDLPAASQAQAGSVGHKM